MSDFDSVYNELARVNGETYLVQDGPLFESPLVRSVDGLLECERDAVQLMYVDEVLDE